MFYAYIVQAARFLCSEYWDDFFIFLFVPESYEIVMVPLLHFQQRFSTHPKRWKFSFISISCFGLKFPWRCSPMYCRYKCVCIKTTRIDFKTIPLLFAFSSLALLTYPSPASTILSNSAPCVPKAQSPSEKIYQHYPGKIKLNKRVWSVRVVISFASFHDNMQPKTNRRIKTR